MITWEWLDKDMNVVLNLWRDTAAQALYVQGEELPDVLPVGQIADVAGTGVKVYAGTDELTAGVYAVTLRALGRTHTDAFTLHGEVMQAAVRTRYVRRTDGGVLAIARFTRINRKFTGSPQNAGTVRVEFQPSTPYWTTGHFTRTITPGVPQSVTVSGNGRAGVQLTLTAGAASITNPFVVTAAGETHWLGTIPAGGTLVINALPGVWIVTLNGADVSARLDGPQPHLLPGVNTVTVHAPGAAVTLAWQEASLAGVTGGTILPPPAAPPPPPPQTIVITKTPTYTQHLQTLTVDGLTVTVPVWVQDPPTP